MKAKSLPIQTLFFHCNADEHCMNRVRLEHKDGCELLKRLNRPMEPMRAILQEHHQLSRVADRAAEQINELREKVELQEQLIVELRKDVLRWRKEARQKKRKR